MCENLSSSMFLRNMWGFNSGAYTNKKNLEDSRNESIDRQLHKHYTEAALKEEWGMGNVGCFFSILSYFSTTSSSVLCFGLRLFFFFSFLPRNWNGNAGNSISIATNISFQLTVYDLLYALAKSSESFVLFRLLLFCYFSFVFVFLDLYFIFFLFFFLRFSFVCVWAA